MSAAGPPSTLRVVALALLVFALLWLVRTAGQWMEHGCGGRQSLRLALEEGAPEWSQYCLTGEEIHDG